MELAKLLDNTEKQLNETGNHAKKADCLTDEDKPQLNNLRADMGGSGAGEGERR